MDGEPLVGFDAVRRLTDDTGMLQHSRFSVPDRNHGYCIDDNARALLLLSWARDLPRALRVEYGSIYAAFIQHAWNADEGRFRNFMGFDRKWLERVGSDDSNGRTYWCLAVAECEFPDDGVQRWAATLLDEIGSKLPRTTSPRTAAFLILGAACILESRPDAETPYDILKSCAGFLMDRYHESRTDHYRWFETSLAYDNARLSEAVLRAGKILNDDRMMEIGLDTLEWLIEWQTGECGRFRPVGTHAFGREFAPKTLFDQQPLEAWATIDACIAAAQCDDNSKWLPAAENAFAWFKAANSADLPVSELKNGECYDGIGESGINLNRGAESVLSWQCAVRRIASVREGT